MSEEQTIGRTCMKHFNKHEDRILQKERKAFFAVVCFFLLPSTADESALKNAFAHFLSLQGFLREFCTKNHKNSHNFTNIDFYKKVRRVSASSNQ